MTPRFLDFSGRLQPHEDLFREITKVTINLNIPFFVVGAFARDLILTLAHGIAVKRATEDIDCGIQVRNWEEFERLKNSLIETGHFQPDKKQQQRFKFQDRIQVDIVPFGAIEEGGMIVWPQEETTMITLGFDEAFNDTITVRLAEDCEIRICSIPGLALMKLIAWNDRRHQTRKDAEDLALLMLSYLDAGSSDRILGDEAEHADLLDDDFDYEQAGARLLGRDVGLLLSQRSTSTVLEILDEQTGELQQYPLVEAMLSNFYGEFEKGLATLECFKQGVVDIVM